MWTRIEVDNLKKAGLRASYNLTSGFKIFTDLSHVSPDLIWRTKEVLESLTVHRGLKSSPDPPQ